MHDLEDADWICYNCAVEKHSDEEFRREIRFIMPEIIDAYRQNFQEGMADREFTQAEKESFEELSRSCMLFAKNPPYYAKNGKPDVTLDFDALHYGTMSIIYP